MKLFAIILSVIVITLAVVPCCTFDNCGDGPETEQANNKKPKDCETPCSPFVNCTCCPGVCITPCIEHVVSPVTIVERTITLYHPSMVSFYCAIIWQPPKIAC